METEKHKKHNFIWNCDCVDCLPERLKRSKKIENCQECEGSGVNSFGYPCQNCRD